jgi:hypothetical protein
MEMRNGPELKKRIRNYLETRGRKGKDTAVPQDFNSIDDIVKFCEDNTYHLPPIVQVKKSSFSSQDEFMAYLVTDRMTMKRQFFLPTIPSMEQCIEIVGDAMMDDLYCHIRGSCSFTTLFGIWCLYLGYSQLPEGGHYHILDGSGEFINDQSMVLQAGWVSTRIARDGTVPNTMYPDCQVLCRKGESAAAVLALHISVQLFLDKVFGYKQIDVFRNPDGNFIDFGGTQSRRG